MRREVWQNGELVSSEELPSEPETVSADQIAVELAKALADPANTLEDVQAVAATLVEQLPDGAQ